MKLKPIISDVLGDQEIKERDRMRQERNAVTRKCVAEAAISALEAGRKSAPSLSAIPAFMKHARRQVRRYVETDRSDPFAYNRAMSSILAGVSEPFDYDTGARA